MSDLVIGIIGVGNIGSRVLNHLSKKYKVYGYDIVKTKVLSLDSESVVCAESNIDVAKECDVIFLSLPGPSEVMETLSSEEGFYHALKSESCIVDLTTNSVDVIQTVASSLRDRGSKFIEMPVSGGVVAAEQGSLSAFVGGNVDEYEGLAPVLDVFTGKRTHYGDYGKATIAKLLNNRIGIQCSFLVIESLVIGAQYAIDPKDLLDSFAAGSGSNAQIQRIRDTIFASDFNKGFPARHAVKDLSLISKLEDHVGACSGATHDAIRYYSKAVESGFLEEDFAIVVKAIEASMKQSLCCS